MILARNITFDEIRDGVLTEVFNELSGCFQVNKSFLTVHSILVTKLVL